jgi:putative photosynthetic complex assembly protein
VSDSFRGQTVPLGALLGAAALIGFSLLAVTTARITGVGGSGQPPPSPAVEARELRFEDRRDGAVLVYEAGGDELVAVVEPGEGGFVRGVLRALARERRAHDAGQAQPFRLARRADGRLTLEDLATGRSIELVAFGPTNVDAFARLLAAGGAPD